MGFYELARAHQYGRLYQERLNDIENPPRLVAIKTDFYCYYHAKDKPYHTETFKEFLVDCNVELKAGDKRWLLKKLFGIEFEFNHTTNKWEQKLAH